VFAEEAKQKKAPTLLTIHMLRKGSRKQTGRNSAGGPVGRAYENALVVRVAHYPSAEDLQQAVTDGAQPGGAAGTAAVQTNLTRLTTVALRQAGLLVPPLFGIGLRLSTKQVLQSRATETALWRETVHELVERSCLQSDEDGNVFLLPTLTVEQKKLQQQLKEAQVEYSMSTGRESTV
jgi:hypothetical protein